MFFIPPRQGFVLAYLSTFLTVLSDHLNNISISINLSQLETLQSISEVKRGYAEVNVWASNRLYRLAIEWEEQRAESGQFEHLICMCMCVPVILHFPFKVFLFFTLYINNLQNSQDKLLSSVHQIMAYKFTIFESHI